MNLKEDNLIPGQEKYIGNIAGTGFGIYDLQQLHVERLISNTIQNHFLMALPDGFLHYGGFESPCYIGYFDYDGNAIWQKDLAEESKYSDFGDKIIKGVIRSVTIYNDSVIVIAGRLVTRIRIATGKVIWQIQKEKYAWPMFFACPIHQH
jgi:hypothetical protein